MKAGCFITLILSIILLATILASVADGSVYNKYYVQASPISSEKPKVILQQGTSGTSTIYTNKTSARVSVGARLVGWWDSNYNYRKKITITDNAAGLPSGYSVNLTIDTKTLVSNGKMLASGNDLRIVRFNGSSWVELDRETLNMNTSSTQVWLKTQSAISSRDSDNSYYVYYGYSGAQTPPANRSRVYDFWDDFNDGSLNPSWTFSQIGEAVGSCIESGSVVTLNATSSGDLWGTSDNFLFLSISRSYDILVESCTSSWGGAPDTWGKMGGVQLRQNLNANSKNRVMSPVYSYTGATNSYRLSAGGTTSETTTSTRPIYCRITRVGGTSRAWYSTDGKSWTELGSQISFSGGLSNPVRLGIPLAGISTSPHWIQVDWFKVRKYVATEPSVSLGPEELKGGLKNDYDYVLKVVNQVTDAWKANMKVYNSTNISRLSNATISFHDGASSDQIKISSGSVTQSEGELYDLTGSATIYISMSNLQASTSGTSYLYVYLKILVPNTSTYNLFIIVFEVT